MIKRVTSILIILTIILSVWPINSSYADTVENLKISKTNQGDLIEFAGEKWLVLDDPSTKDSTEIDSEGIMVILKDSAGKVKYMDEANGGYIQEAIYDASKIKDYLNIDFLNNRIGSSHTGSIKEHTWNCGPVGDEENSRYQSTCKVGLLTVSEYISVRDTVFSEEGSGFWWWLMSPNIITPYMVAVIPPEDVTEDVIMIDGYWQSMADTSSDRLYIHARPVVYLDKDTMVVRTNRTPELSISNPTGATTEVILGQNLNLKGDVVERDTGDTVTVKYEVLKDGTPIELDASGNKEKTMINNQNSTGVTPISFEDNISIDKSIFNVGTYKIRVWATDGTNTTSKIERTIQIKKTDNHMPVLNLNPISSTYGYQQSINIAGNATDVDSQDMISVSYKIKDSLDTEVKSGTIISSKKSNGLIHIFTDSITINNTEFSDGNYTLEVIAEDNKGGTTTATKTFEVKNHNPIINIGSVSSTYSQGSLLGINGSISDVDIEDLLSATYTIEDNTGSPLTGHDQVSLVTSVKSSGVDHSFSNDVLLGSALFPEGTYTLKIEVQDNQGGIASVTKSFTVEKSSPGSNNSPVLNLNPTNSEYGFEQTLRIAGDISDADIGDILSATYTLEDSSGSPVTGYSNVTLINNVTSNGISHGFTNDVVIDLNLFAEDMYTIKVTVSDGKVNTDVPRTFQVRNNSPEINLDSIGSTYSQGVNLALSGNIFDIDPQDTLTASYTIKDSNDTPINGHNAAQLVSSITSDGTVHYFTNNITLDSSLFPEGTYTIEANVQDNRGKSSQEVRSFTVQTGSELEDGTIDNQGSIDGQTVGIENLSDYIINMIYRKKAYTVVKNSPFTIVVAGHETIDDGYTLQGETTEITVENSDSNKSYSERDGYIKIIGTLYREGIQVIDLDGHIFIFNVLSDEPEVTIEF